MSSTNAVRPRGTSAIEARIVSERAKGGAYSCFARLKAANLSACAAHIAGIFSCREPDADELMRAVQLYQKRYPGASDTVAEITASIRTARHIEQRVIPVRDINKQLVNRLTALERLNLANTGRLPDRFLLLGPDDV